MQRILMAFALAVLLWPARPAAAQQQQSGSTRLAVNVVPESRLDPARILVRFTVSPDGAADLASQSVPVTAWVRALPGSQIHVTARLSSVIGPSGSAPDAVIEWNGAVARASSGAESAACAGGSFASGPLQELVSGWTQSGVLTCNLTFRLANPRALAPGSYTAAFDLAVTTR